MKTYAFIVTIIAIVSIAILYFKIRKSKRQYVADGLVDVQREYELLDRKYKELIKSYVRMRNEREDFENEESKTFNSDIGKSVLDDLSD